MKELSIQTDIIKSVRQDGGWARKMSHKFQVGIPDLLIALPPFMPIVMEVKQLGKVGEKFTRKIDIQLRQAVELEAFADCYLAYGQAALVAVAFESADGKIGLWLGDHEASRLSSEVIALQPERIAWRAVGKYFDLKPAFRKVGVPYASPL